MLIKAGKYFDHNRLIDYLGQIERIFNLAEDRQLENLKWDFSKVEQVSIVNLLVFCKLVEYTFENGLLKKPTMVSNAFVDDRLRFFDFNSLLEAYTMKTGEEAALKNLYVRQESGFLIAPQPLVRSDFSFRSKLNAVYLPEIQRYYNSVNHAVGTVFTCLSELSLNFWAHAIGDNHSILMAYGNKNKIEIACADTGAGIISTLKHSGSSDLSGLSNVAILTKSIERGVTSKKNTNHMGYGLWLVTEIVKRMGGVFGLYSEGAYLQLRGEKMSVGTCGYWKGAIVYLSIPLHNCFPLDKLTPEFQNSVEINWQ